MKNKKLLNIFLLLLSLFTFIAFILTFKFVPYAQGTQTFILFIYWITNSVFMVSLIIVIFLTLISLFMDDYITSKIVETFVTLAFFMTFLNVVIFAMSKTSLSFSYIIVSILALITCSISQILRLAAGFKTWKKDLVTLIKPHKPVTIISAVEPKEDPIIMVDGGRVDQRKEHQKNKEIKENKIIIKTPINEKVDEIKEENKEEK